jgi:4-amino-4-deoxy-L-arabinose transferase-like glycosyltransferase
MALAVLAKGPVGVLLPLVVIGSFLYAWAVLNRPHSEEAQTSPSRVSRWGQRLKHWFQPALFFRIAWGVRPYWIVVCLAVIALPWYVAVGLKTDGVWLAGFLGQHNLVRFLKPMEGHHGPVLYYPTVMLIGFFPWSVFCLPVIRGAFGRWKRGTAESPGLVFVACWFLVYLLFFTCARTKLPNYVLPCYPAMALLTAWWFERASEAGAFPKAHRDFTWAAWSWIGAGVAMAIGLGAAASFLLPGETVLALAGLVPIVGGSLAWWVLKSRGLAAARIAFVAVGAAFVLAMFVWAAPRISRHQDGAYLAGQIRLHQSQSARIATYNYFPVGLVFYAERPIERCRVPADIPEVLSGPKGLVITRADRLEELKPYLPPGTKVLARRQRFLRQHDIVILGQKEAPIPLAGQTGGSPRN